MDKAQIISRYLSGNEHKRGSGFHFSFPLASGTKMDKKHSLLKKRIGNALSHFP
jgi:hypothetical protein